MVWECVRIWAASGVAYLCPSQSKCDSQLPEQDANVACRCSTGRLWGEDEDVIDSAFVIDFVRPPRPLLSFCSNIFCQHGRQTACALHLADDSSSVVVM